MTDLTDEEMEKVVEELEGGFESEVVAESLASGEGLTERRFVLRGERGFRTPITMASQTLWLFSYGKYVWQLNRFRSESWAWVKDKKINGKYVKVDQLGAFLRHSSKHYDDRHEWVKNKHILKVFYEKKGFLMPQTSIYVQARASHNGSVWATEEDEIN